METSDSFCSALPPRVAWRRPWAFVLPDGPSFYLAKKKQKCDLWAAPLRTRFSKKGKVKGKGQGKGPSTPCSHLKPRTDAGTLQPEVVVLEGPMVKGGGYR